MMSLYIYYIFLCWPGCYNVLYFLVLVGVLPIVYIVSPAWSLPSVSNFTNKTMQYRGIWSWVVRVLQGLTHDHLASLRMGSTS